MGKRFKRGGFWRFREQSRRDIPSFHHSAIPDLAPPRWLRFRDPSLDSANGTYSGQIGLTGFRCLMRDPRMQNIPIVLETPSPLPTKTEAGDLAIWAKEIEMLYEIQGIEDDEWEERKEGIVGRWREERDLLKPPEEKKPRKKSAGKGKKDEEDVDDEEEDE